MALWAAKLHKPLEAILLKRGIRGSGTENNGWRQGGQISYLAILGRPLKNCLTKTAQLCFGLLCSLFRKGLA